MKKLFTIAACLTATALLQSQTTIFVKPDGTGDGTSWATACSLETAVGAKHISASLNDLVSPLPETQIWVQKGTYYPTKMLVVPDSVKIYGGFSGTENNLSQRNFVANPTIVDGQQKIGSIFRLENAAELHGLTIQNGNANDNPHKNGGGVWADENCVIANCIITHNTAILNGGGIYAKGKVKIINSIVENNVANSSGNDLFGNCVVLGFDQSGTSSGVEIEGCNPSFLYLGDVNFKSENTISVAFDGITLIWSDVVMAEGCNKTTFYGGASGSYYSDCRSNSPRATYGDLFSWCAVARFAHVLCPAPWRTPTKEDFAHLDKAMGGDGSGFSPDGNTWGSYYYNNTVRDKYLNTWNRGFYGGYCDAVGTLYGQVERAHFWSQSEHETEFGYPLDFYSNGLISRVFSLRLHGFTLRCVR